MSWRWFVDPPEDPPDDDSRQPKPIPSTMVRVICAGCQKPIDIRVRKKDNGHKTVSCHNCLQVIEVTVNNMKSVDVWMSRPNGSNRHRAKFEKIWQEE